MPSFDPALRKLVGRITKLTTKIEHTAIDQPKAGHFENRFGTYDRADLTSDLFEVFDTLLRAAPTEDYFRYLYAGALARANRLKDAEVEYRALRESLSSYAKHAVLMLVPIYLQLEDRASAEAVLASYNERMEREGFPQLRRTLDDLAIRR